MSNPVLQYTFFEQLKNFLVMRRKERLAAGAKGAAVVAATAVTLSDLDYFFLGALSKLCKWGYPSSFFVFLFR